MSANNSPLEIVQVVSSVEEIASGPSYTVPRLAESLASRSGVVVSLASLGEASMTVAQGVTHKKYKRDLAWAGPFARLGFSASMRKAILSQPADILHTHGLWMMPNVYPAHAAKRNRSKLVLSPRGMLGEDALKFSKRKKQAFWWLFQKSATDQVSCFHATSDQELADIRRFGLHQPIAVIPNGIDLPDLTEIAVTDPNLEATRMRTLLSLGRVHPKKGLDRLLVAWSEIAEEFPDWRLRIVGPSEGGHGAELSRMISNQHIKRASIEQPIFGQAKQILIRNSDLFVLPTLNENFAVSVAESLAVETPVISTKGAPWHGLVENKCGWWIEHGKEAMVLALKQAMELSDEERHQMGKRGRNWMARDFGWDRVSDQMFDVYSWLVGRRKVPDWVEV